MKKYIASVLAVFMLFGEVSSAISKDILSSESSTSSSIPSSSTVSNTESSSSEETLSSDTPLDTSTSTENTEIDTNLESEIEEEDLPAEEEPPRDPGDDEEEEEEEKLFITPNTDKPLANFTGSFEADLFTGAGTFRYPLWVPKGRKGLTPNISLSYTSNESQFDSLVGYGWSLPTNAVYRSTRHGTNQLYNRNDFTADINGQTQELIVINEDQGLYGARIETGFTKFEFTDNHWIGTSTNGTQYTFGSSETTQQINPEDETQIYKWLLERVEDLDGNFITYTYTEDLGQVYPDRIRYTGHDQEDGLFEIRFVWDTRPAIRSYERGFRVITDKILSQIQIYSYETNPEKKIFHYSLQHQARNNAVVHLTQISVEADQDSTAVFPPTNFQYFEGTESTEYRKIDLLKQIEFPLGSIQQFFYQSATAYRDEVGDITNKLPFIVFTLHESHLYPSGNLNEDPQITQYSYEGGHYYYDQLDAFKKEYSGFHLVTITDPVGNIGKMYFHQSESSPDNAESSQMGEFEDHISKKGRIYREEQYDDNGNLFTKTIRRWDKRPLADANPEINRYFPFLSQEISSTYDGNEDARSTAGNYIYDGYGNLIHSIDFGEVSPVDERGNFNDILEDRIEIQQEFVLNENNYITSLLSHKTVKDSLMNIIGEERHFYDNQPLGFAINGNETIRETRINANEFINTQKEYNNYGLAFRIRNPRGYITNISFGIYNLYPRLITNTLGHNTQLQYSGYSLAYGVPQEIIDPNFSRRQTTIDGLGRVKEEKISHPQNAQLITTTKYAYSPFSRPASINTQKFFHQNSWNNGQEGPEIVINTWTYLDGLGREIQTRIQTEDLNQYMVSGKTYDERGNVDKEFLPKFGNGYTYQPILQNQLGNEYEYDALGRPISVTNPLGTTTTEYDQWEQIITDANENRKDFVFDARENLTEVKEYLGVIPYITKYVYNPLNQLIRIKDPKQNIKNMTYDLRGLVQTEEDFHINMDPTFSVWSFDYDQNGNLIQTETPNGETINFIYDELDRLVTEDWEGEEDPEVQYIYDQGQNAIGRLSEVSFPGGGKNFTYDQLGRVTSQTITIGEENFSLQFTYDIAGNPITITYPDGTIILNRYNSAGLPEGVQRIIGEDEEDIITGTKYTATGAIEVINYTNGISTNNIYDINQLYRLTHKITRRTADQVKLQDISYEYDPVGNITRIEDESVTNTAKIAEYEYDDLYRLTSAEITETANNDDYIRTYSYDILGNILTHSEFEDPYLYAGMNSAQAFITFASPHAVTSIGEIEFEYDNNGNLISDGDWEHSWDYKDRLISSIQGENQEILYTYDEAKQRIRKENVGEESATIYVDKYFDREGGRTKAHIFAGGTKVATLETEDEVETLVFHHEDHLTGANVDTDSDGEVVQLLDYFPYGDTRIDEHDEDYHNDYQFTGKERDEETGLSYYEARYYNSGIGRFISRDTWEGDLKDPQSLNKYSYVQNNPLKYVDPSGDEKLTVVIEMPGDGLLQVGHTGIAIDNEYYDYGPQTEHGKSISGNFGGVKGGPLWDQSSQVTNDGNASLQDVLIALQSNKIAKGRDVFTITAEITSEQAQTIQSYWDNRNKNPGTYHLLGKQCTTTVAESLNNAGLIGTPASWEYNTPMWRWKGLYDKFQTSEPKAFLNYLQKNLKNTQGDNKGQQATVQKISNNDNDEDDKN